MEVSLHVTDGLEVTCVLSELLWNGKILAALWRFCWIFFLLCRQYWKLKLGHLNMELRLSFLIERVTEI